MTIVVLFGPPGSGKGTQAVYLAEKFNLKHISTGDLFRYNIGNKTELGILAKTFIDNGNLVPDEVTNGMLKEELLKNYSEKGFILDGYPRNIAQAQYLDLMLEELFKTSVKITLSLKVADEILVERIKGRALSSGRVDDANETIIKNRIKVYYEETHPVSEFYKKQNKWLEVQGEGSIQEITQTLSNTLESIQ